MKENILKIQEIEIYSVIPPNVFRQFTFGMCVMNPSSLLRPDLVERNSATGFGIIMHASAACPLFRDARFLRAYFGISYYVVCGVTMSFYYKIWDSFTWGCDFRINKHVTGLCGFLIAAEWTSTGSNKFINPLAPSEHITYRDVFQTNICTHVLAERRLALSIHSHTHTKRSEKNPRSDQNFG